MKAEQIIQEALEVGVMETPTSFIDKLFYCEPSREKLQSRSIWYLTNRIIQAREDKEKAEIEKHAIFREALRIIAMFDPKKEQEFFQKFSPLNSNN